MFDIDFFVNLEGTYFQAPKSPPPPLPPGCRRQYQNLGSQPGRFFGSRSSTVGSWPLVFSGLLVLTGRVCCRAHSPQLPQTRLAASGQSHAATQHDADARQDSALGAYPPTHTHRDWVCKPQNLDRLGGGVHREAQRETQAIQVTREWATA